MGSYYSSGSSYFASGGIPHPVGTTITSVGPNSAVGAPTVSCAQPASSAIWPAANRAIYVPILLDQTVLIKQMFTYNGTVAAGNIDIGIYDSTGASASPGTKLVSSGSTAQSGTSTLQTFDIADTTLTPGLYYFAMAMSDAATATIFRSSVNLLVLSGAGVGQQASALPLPSTATPASPGSSYVPVFGASLVTVI